ncbi:MarR family winged helix-turn-helix transcriptional regulator [Thermomonospora umbrina]|uniref:DNA-binding MarR family transcriptional regulator n=1 Tax=Thermomonospora umbrina TaxID=111806 RepID=A0A3D9ST67_9ACTN|nr:MarR family transcriptional regulator [Thermomonospora umbrina]REE94891.1 DNA-binding MarR family transcriptional regulator [Thermomonospora umbrina]
MQTTSSVDRLADGLLDLMTYVTKSAQGGILRDVRELELSLSQVRTLFLVDRAPSPPALHELAAELGLSMASAGRAADALVRHSLAERHEDASDRRVKRITLTAAGRDVLARLHAARRDDLRRFAETLTEEERTGLVNALAPILNRPDVRALTIGTHC